MLAVSAILSTMLLVAVAALAPVAAKPQPVIYFLKDAEVSPGYRLPIGDGELSTLPPAPLDLVNPANNTPPSTRVIYPYASAVLPTQFAANASANTGRIHGVVAAYLFLPKSPAMQSATLNVSLVALPKDPEVPPPLGGGGDLIAWARVPLDYENTTLPNATSWVELNATDPQSMVNYTSGQLLAYGITTLYSSGLLVYLDDNVPDYLVDRTIDPEARLALRLTLENGTAISPLPAVPQPVGAGQDIVYDFALAFSLVLVPWYAPDDQLPPTQTTTTRPATTTSPGATSNPGGPSGTTTTTEAPVLPFGILVLLALGSAWLVRRRL